MPDPITHPAASLAGIVTFLMLAGVSTALAFPTRARHAGHTIPEVPVLKRDPAVLFLALLVPVTQAIVSLTVTDPGLAGGINAVAVALAGAATAVLVHSDRQLPALTGLAQAALALIVGLGVSLTPEQQGLVLAPVAIVLGFVVRSQVDAQVDAAGNDRSIRYNPPLASSGEWRSTPPESA